MEYIKGCIKGYDEVIYKLVTAVLWLGIGGMIGYAMGAYKVFTMVME